ncbi:class I SAM-dependent methyltransferase [Polyangium aurulentum]|uniref:class I SAM-dependent methyltransferase n=1 Tax=Polyangium aurulentum TaxID=2567896 RepID=UPI0010AE3675|nr:class I SAM-dependent methyltransferase [Polyangium aurulentum]UQA54592.1 methyltransferase domain-containing protein [Polyangium aurulentum]
MSEENRPLVAGEALPQAVFHQAYEGLPPWVIGRPQAEVVALVEAGGVSGEVLDVGCGTGENAILIAERGHAVTGIDLVPKAIEIARANAAARGVKVDFQVGSALELAGLGRTFDTVLDAGLFHAFNDEDRARYVDGLGHVVRRGGIYYMLVFSDREPPAVGPRRVRQAEIHAAFVEGWRVREIRPARYEHAVGDKGYAEAWLASIERTG